MGKGEPQSSNAFGFLAYFIHFPGKLCILLRYFEPFRAAVASFYLLHDFFHVFQLETGIHLIIRADGVPLHATLLLELRERAFCAPFFCEENVRKVFLETRLFPADEAELPLKDGCFPVHAASGTRFRHVQALYLKKPLL